MKTFTNLWDDLISFENLYESWRKARRNKTAWETVRKFGFHIEKVLWNLQEELSSMSYQPGEYDSFVIYKPKERIITRAPFRDRIVHHALINIIEPIFEARFYAHSYACRVGKGTHNAMRQAHKYLEQSQYYMKCDLKKYFPSINHEILKQLLFRYIADEKVRWLIEKIVDVPCDCVKYDIGDDLLSQDLAIQGVGIPIGNLTSQFFANVYLNPFDHFVKDELRCPSYIRYMDDFVFFSDSKERLHGWLEQAEDYLLNRLRLKVHETKRQIFPCRDGLDFVGYRIYPDVIRVRKSSCKAFIRRYRHLLIQQKKHRTNRRSEKLRGSIAGWVGHIQQAYSNKLRRDILSRIPKEVFAR